jgi:CHAT domain-containing protein/tetratricopeptide (TPR) repeat protein
MGPARRTRLEIDSITIQLPDIVVAVAMFGIVGCTSPLTEPANAWPAQGTLIELQASAVQRSHSAPVDSDQALGTKVPAAEVDLSREEALIDDATAALRSGDYVTARAKVDHATSALLSRPASEHGEAWLEFLDSCGGVAWSARGLRTASIAWERVLEVRSSRLQDDDPDLQQARQNFALTVRAMGDLARARALQEKVLEVHTRILPEDHADLQAARGNLAVTIKALGDLQNARVLQEKMLDVCSRTLAGDHPDLQGARLNLAATLYQQGDLAGARVLCEQVLEVQSRTLPADHLDLQKARQGLALIVKATGEVARARSLEEKVLEVLSRTLPWDDGNLQAARGNLAVTRYELGDLEGARALFEQVLEVFSRTLPGDHPDLQKARQNLAASIQALGDLSVARALQEQVLEVWTRTLPGDHPDLQSARGNLATTMYEIGDLAGARALSEQVLEAYSRTLPADHPNLQTARLNLANTLKGLGELAGARELEEKVLEVRTQTLPDEHPQLQTARGNLAVTIKDLGDFSAARALEEHVLDVLSRTLPDDHPDLQAARLNLAQTLESLGDLSGARALGQEGLDGFSRRLPDDHPDLQVARETLAAMIAAQCALDPELEGQTEGRSGTDKTQCQQLVLDVCRTQTRAARAVLLSASSREAEERCARISEKLGLGLSFARGFGVFDRNVALEQAAFELSETTRGAALAAARLARRASGDARYAERRAALVRASEELATLVRREGTNATDFDRARVQCETAERELASLAREVVGGRLGGVEVSAATLASALGKGVAAVGFRRFRDSRVEVQLSTDSDAMRVTKEVYTERLCAFVVRGPELESPMAEASANLTLVDLGPVGPIERAVREWRAAIGVAAGRGVSVVGSEVVHNWRSSGDTLRGLVFDPWLHTLGESRRLVLVLDDVLHLVAFDALPLDPSGVSLVGDRWVISTRATLAELLDPAPSPATGGRFLALGGVSYDGEGMRERANPIADGSSTGGRGGLVADILRGSAWAGGFSALPATLEEVDGIDRSFARSFGSDAEHRTLTGAQATKENLLALAPGARYLHVATHGWFASESIDSWSDPSPIDAQSGLGVRLSGSEQVKGMSPMLLCGLALTNANLPVGAVGRASSLITAEEIAALDLSGCELAVLSACDTNVGERRAGQGVASLQRALQMAGVRTVITSLWKVPDEGTKELMLDFYHRIWVEKTPKAQALWESKKRLRDAMNERGEPLYTVRDWAGWVLTGAPD